jgi:hypothetical protein
VDFAARGSDLIAEGHGHTDADLRTGLAAALAADRVQTQAQAHADAARISETWYSDEAGFGHDCAGHQDVDRRLWSPHCGTFRPVTIADGIPAAANVERARPAEADASGPQRRPVA